MRRPGIIALEMAIQSSTGAALDTDYRGISVPNLQVTRPTFATPQVIADAHGASISPKPARTPTPCPSPSRIVQPHRAAADTRARIRRRQQRTRRHRAPAQQAGHPDARSLPGGRRTAAARLRPVRPPLASLAPDEYRVELAAANPTGPRDEAKEMVTFRVTELSRVILLLRIPY